MFTDFILNGQAHGAVGERLNHCRFDPGMMRPYLDSKGRQCVTINTGRMEYDKDRGIYVPVHEKMLITDLQKQGISSPVFNTTTLRKEEWIQFDNVVVRAARQRLRAWTDLAASSTYGGFNGMSKLTLEYEAMSDPGEAVVDMDGLSDGRGDTPLFNLRSLPLPITHSDWWLSARQLAESRNSGMPLDTVMAEAAGRRVAEMIEKTVIGVEAGVTYGTVTTGPTAHTGTSTVYGYTNFPYRTTKTDLTVPTGSNPDAIMTDILEMVETLQSNGFFGPYILYHSTAYSRYLADDYFRTGSTSAVRSVRDRLMEIEGLQDIRRLDYLTSGFQLLLVQMDPMVAQAVDAMPITTLQWETHGGMKINFKVMAIQVPRLRYNYAGTTGIVHGTTS